MQDEYEGLPIRKHSLAIRGASGDALSGVLKVKPQDFTPGVPVYVLLEAIPTGARFDEMDDGEAWELVNITKAQRSTIVTPAVALPYLNETAVALEDLRVKETGQERLEVTTRMSDDHWAGLHKNRRKKCDLCYPPDGSDPQPVGPAAKAVVDELAARRDAEEGPGDPENPLPPARRYRTKKGAAKKKPPTQTSTRL